MGLGLVCMLDKSCYKGILGTLFYNKVLLLTFNSNTNFGNEHSLQQRR